MIPNDSRRPNVLFVDDEREVTRGIRLALRKEPYNVLTANSANARALVARLPGLLQDRPAPCPCGCDRALEHAVMTAPDKRDPALVARLDAVAGRVLGG